MYVFILKACGKGIASQITAGIQQIQVQRWGVCWFTVAELGARRTCSFTLCRFGRAWSRLGATSGGNALSQISVIALGTTNNTLSANHVGFGFDMSRIDGGVAGILLAANGNTIGGATEQEGNFATGGFPLDSLVATATDSDGNTSELSLPSNLIVDEFDDGSVLI